MLLTPFIKHIFVFLGRTPWPGVMVKSSDLMINTPIFKYGTRKEHASHSKRKPRWSINISKQPVLANSHASVKYSRRRGFCFPHPSAR